MDDATPAQDQPGTGASAGRTRRVGDTTVVLVTALVIVLGGLAVAFGIRWVSGGGGDGSATGASDCPDVAPLGVSRLLRDDPDLEAIPQYRLIGPGCDLWLAKVDGEVVAVRGTQPGLGCTVKPDAVTEAWECEGEPVDFARLEQWPLEVRTVNGEPGILVAVFAAPTP